MSEEISEGVNNDVGIGIQDIANAVQIIDIVTERGAIKGGELSSVGGVRDRLAAFVQANTPASEEPPADETATEDSAETVEVDTAEV